MYEMDLTPDFLDDDDEEEYRPRRPAREPISSLDKSKAMTKKELAEHLGVNPRTLSRWLELLGEKELPGYKQRKLLTPALLKIISEKLCL